MKTVFEMLELWPTINALATDLRRPYDTVAAWKRRQRIPVGEWDAVIASAKSRKIRGVTRNKLHSLHSVKADSAGVVSM